MSGLGPTTVRRTGPTRASAKAATVVAETSGPNMSGLLNLLIRCNRARI
jgi:hypothetical protein